MQVVSGGVATIVLSAPSGTPTLSSFQAQMRVLIRRDLQMRTREDELIVAKNLAEEATRAKSLFLGTYLCRFWLVVQSDHVAGMGLPICSMYRFRHPPGA